MSFPPSSSFSALPSQSCRSLLKQFVAAPLTIYPQCASACALMHVPSQAVAVPHILRGEDAVVAAETGSGKTHTYLVAIAQSARMGFLAGALGESPSGQREAGRDTQGLVERSEATVRRERRHRGHKFALVLCPNATLCRQVQPRCANPWLARLKRAQNQMLTPLFA